MLDQGQTHEAIIELDNLSGQPRLEFKRSLTEELRAGEAASQTKLGMGLLVKAIGQKKIGDHGEALETLTSCIA